MRTHAYPPPSAPQLRSHDPLAVLAPSLSRSLPAPARPAPAPIRAPSSSSITQDPRPRPHIYVRAACSTPRSLAWVNSENCNSCPSPDLRSPHAHLASNSYPTTRTYPN
ncbi:hypothetical protein FIBSPDRAFT_297785 [Athelia psychrophila]|uniref:Uncharacterized protein n=1 Tax=Athelia psychrophila TaxID=1759441 RepID=A0A166QT86_9AGAM|nr:hypothetical protein FIBSPDRAFT_297785 [Fibularhizoctonia sp. CBS 109695]